MDEPKFGDIVVWDGGQHCMVITTKPAVFVQLDYGDVGSGASEILFEPKESNYPFAETEHWARPDG